MFLTSDRLVCIMPCTGDLTVFLTITKDKEALEVFVQKDGLTSLAELLAKWEDQVETEQGILLVLKVKLMPNDHTLLGSL